MITDFKQDLCSLVVILIPAFPEQVIYCFVQIYEWIQWSNWTRQQLLMSSYSSTNSLTKIYFSLNIDTWFVHPQLSLHSWLSGQLHVSPNIVGQWETGWPWGYACYSPHLNDQIHSPWKIRRLEQISPKMCYLVHVDYFQIKANMRCLDITDSMGNGWANSLEWWWKAWHGAVTGCKDHSVQSRQELVDFWPLWAPEKQCLF